MKSTAPIEDQCVVCPVCGTKILVIFKNLNGDEAWTKGSGCPQCKTEVLIDKERRIAVFERIK